MMAPDLALVVPCYNEAARLAPAAFLEFLSTRPGVHLLPVNDGSDDATGEVLRRLQEHARDRVTVLTHPERRGKAEAVRTGVRAGLETGASLVGFFDADLATPLAAVDDFLAVLHTRPAIDLVLGSRVMLMGRDIERRPARHYLGRVFATAVSLALDLPVYDTQCGAKVWRVNAATSTLMATPFRSPWIFDVELILRYLQVPSAAGEPPRRDRIYELALSGWHDKPGSKLRWYDFAHAVPELAYIWRTRVAHRRSPASGVPARGERDDG